MLIWLYTFLLAAVFFDVRLYRIPNRLIAAGLASGILLQGFCLGLPGVYAGLTGMAVIFAAGLPLFIIKALGAGDLKLFCVIAVYLGYGETLRVMFISMIFGVILGISKFLISEASKIFKNRQRLSSGHIEPQKAVNTMEIKKEEALKQQWKVLEGLFRSRIRFHFVHFSIAVLLGVITVIRW